MKVSPTKKGRVWAVMPVERHHWSHHRIPRVLPHGGHGPLHKLIHERTGWPWGPWGYFHCRACDQGWFREHPEDRFLFEDRDWYDGFGKPS